MELPTSKDNSSRYPLQQQIAALAATVPTGCTKYFDCPKCRRQRKFGMTNKTLGIVYQCFAASCSLKGIVSTHNTFISKERLSAKIKGAREESDTFSIPDYFINGFASESGLKMAMRYDLLTAYSKGLFKTSYDPRLNRQVFYYDDIFGNVVGATGRALQVGVKPKAYIYQGSIKTPVRIGSSDVAVVCEDFFSCIRAFNAGYTGISLSGTNISIDHLEYFKGFNTIIMALDKDATVKSIRAKKLLDLVCNKVLIMLLDKDLKDMTNEQVKGMVAQRLEQGAHNALVGGSNPSHPTNKKQQND